MNVSNNEYVLWVQAHRKHSLHNSSSRLFQAFVSGPSRQGNRSLRGTCDKFLGRKAMARWFMVSCCCCCLYFQTNTTKTSSYLIFFQKKNVLMYWWWIEGMGTGEYAFSTAHASFWEDWLQRERRMKTVKQLGKPYTFTWKHKMKKVDGENASSPAQAW